MTFGSALRLVRLGIDTYQEPVVYMRADCHVCRSEGFTAHSRVQVATGTSKIVATLNVVHGDLLHPHEAGLSESAWLRLGARTGESATFSHAPPAESLGAVRAKTYGHALTDLQLEAIVRDVGAHRYADIEIAALLTSFAAAGLSRDEIIGLTRGMIAVGDQLRWGREIVAERALEAAGAARIVTTRTVEHPTNEIEIAGLLAGPVRSLIG